MSTIAAAGAAQAATSQAMQQSIAAMKNAAESQQAVVEMLQEATGAGEKLAQNGSMGTQLNTLV